MIAWSRLERPRQTTIDQVGRGESGTGKYDPLTVDGGIVERRFCGGSAFFSISRSMSISILVARNSAAADLLTSWAITASRLVTWRRLPFSVTVTFSLSAAANNAGRFLQAGRAGC